MADFILLTRTLRDALRTYGTAFSAIVASGNVADSPCQVHLDSRPPRCFADAEIIAAVVAELTSEVVVPVSTAEATTTLLVALASSRRTPATNRGRAVAAMKAARIALPSRVACRLTPRFEGPVPQSVMTLAFRTTLARPSPCSAATLRRSPVTTRALDDPDVRARDSGAISHRQE